MSWEMGAVRVIFVIIITTAAMHLQPFGLSGLKSAILGSVLGLFFVLFEIRLEKASLKRLLGAAFGSILGILGALMISHLLSMTAIEPTHDYSVLELGASRPGEIAALARFRQGPFRGARLLYVWSRLLADPDLGPRVIGDVLRKIAAAVPRPGNP